MSENNQQGGFLRNLPVLVKVLGGGAGIAAVIAAFTNLVTAVRQPTTHSTPPPSSSQNRKTENPSQPHPTSLPSASENQKFFVIAASSEYKKDLANEPKRVKLKMGSGFEDRYRDIKICLSMVDSKKFYLVLGSSLQQKDAELLKNQAINDGFRKDTYVLEESEIDFKLSDCRQL